MRTRILLLLFGVLFAALSTNAATYNVTLKVVDQSKGQITNKVNDNNEQNIFTWLDDGLRALNPSKTAGEWWWPMYNDAEFASVTNGALVKTSDAWEWTLPLKVGPGTYKWNPHCKTNGWVPIRGNGGAVMYHYEGDDESGNLVFTVAENGTITGSTSLIIPDPTTQPKYSFTLKVIDHSAGELSDAPGTWAEGANIIAWITDELNPMHGVPTPNFWFYGFFDKEINWENSGTMVQYPEGKLIKEDDKWTWQATFEATPGTYQWNPMNIAKGFQSLIGGNLTFTVNADGSLSGDYITELGGASQIFNLTLNLSMAGKTVDPAGIHVAGSFNGWNTTSTPLTDENGDGIYSVTIPVQANTDPYQYKFLNGNTWGTEETVFGNCAYRSNRIVWVTDQDVDVDVAVLGYCGAVDGIDAIKVACIGDSNTEGAGVSEGDRFTKSWPVQMRDELGDDYYTENLGVSGATLMALPDPWGAWTNNVQYGYNKLLDPDVILVALGTNDSKVGGSYWGARDFSADYINLVNEFKAYPAKPEVYMVTPIKAYDNGYAISDDNIRNGVIPAIKELSKTQMLPVIDWYTVTESLSKDGYIPDGVHANAVTLQMMAEKAAQILLMKKPQISTDDQNGDLYSEYRWYLDGQLINGAAAASYTATQYGVYNVAVKPFANTEDVIISEPFTLSVGTLPIVLKTTSNPTSIHSDVSDAKNIHYYSEILTVEGCENEVLYVYNTSGMKVKQVNVLQAEDHIDLGDLPKGFYVCKVANLAVKIVK